MPSWKLGFFAMTALWAVTLGVLWKQVQLKEAWRIDATVWRLNSNRALAGYDHCVNVLQRYVGQR